MHRRFVPRISVDNSLLTNLLIILRLHYHYFAENPAVLRAALRTPWRQTVADT